MDFPTPELTDINRPYWQALEEGYLAFQRCTCGHSWLPPRRHCPVCLSSDASWVRARGTGTLVSWVTYHTAYHPAFKDRLPYKVALVQLDEGPRMLTNIVGPCDALQGDARVTLAIERESNFALPRFKLTSPAAGFGSLKSETPHA